MVINELILELYKISIAQTLGQILRCGPYFRLKKNISCFYSVKKKALFHGHELANEMLKDFEPHVFQSRMAFKI